MSRRLFTLLLALCLVWVGASSQEVATAAGVASAQMPTGSVDDHHLDDLPAQTLAELGVDLPALVRASSVLPPASVAAADVAAYRPPGLAAPCLDGLLRPPQPPARHA